MTTTSQLWYDYVLQQMAAESYLEGIRDFVAEQALVEQRLVAGNNRPNFGEPGNPIGVTRFTDEQAEEFTDNFLIRHQWSDNPTSHGSRPIQEGDIGYIELDGQQVLANSGLSATLIQRKDENGNLKNEYTLAIRSTELRDLDQGGDRDRDAVGADLKGVVSKGLALAQLAALENYYAWLKATDKLPVGASLNVTGYSLGGHLATAFTEMHVGDVDISFAGTYTFNGAGRGTWTRSADTPSQVVDYYQKVLDSPFAGRQIAAELAESGVRPLEFYRAHVAATKGAPLDPLSLYGDARHLWAQTAASEAYGLKGIAFSDKGSADLRSGATAKITQVYGKENPLSSTLVANSGVHGPAVGVFSEAQPFLEGVPGLVGGSGDFGNAHSIVLLADSLALMRTFQQLDPAAGTELLGQLFAESSARRSSNSLAKDNAGSEENALESALDSLRKLFLGTGIAPTPFTVGLRGAGDLDSRNAFYENIRALERASQFGDAVGKVTINLMPLDAADIVAAARSDIAYRYALATLTPFAVIGRPELFNLHNGNGELELFDPKTGAGALTEAYLKDRAEFLEAQIDASRRNSGYSIADAGRPSVLNEDWRGLEGRDPVKAETVVLDPGVAIDAGRPLEKLPNDVRADRMRRLFLEEERKGRGHRILFGSNGNPGTPEADPDTTVGGRDALTGNRGSDRMYGGRGNDVLRGEAGDDHLQGDSGSDRLHGDAGSDTLIGGVGNDTLHGGHGTDKYYFYTGGGEDTVTDVAEVIDGAKRQLGEIYFGGIDGDIKIAGEFTATDPDRKRYTYTGSDGKTYVADYQGDVTTATPGTLELRREGDDTNVVTLNAFISGDFGIVLDSNAPQRTYTEKQGTGLPDNDFLIGVPHASSLSSDSPDQKVFGFGGADRIHVLHANAQAIGGEGNDYAFNGEGDQSLFGDAGRDVLVATAGEDHLEGGADDDALQGGADADYLDGGDGHDVLDGGAGEDVIAGGEGNDFIFGGGSATVVIANWDAFAEGSLDWGAVDASGDVLLRGLTGVSNIEGDGADVITTGAGRDWAFAGDGADVVFGGEGDDYLVGQAGNDSVSGDEGNDQLYGDGAQGDLVAGTDMFSVFALPQAHGHDVLRGGAGADFLSGDGGADDLYGDEDDDTLVGDSANVPEEFHGADYLDGGDGNDQLLGYGKGDSLFGGAGNDVLGGDSSSIAASQHGEDYLDGEEGDDTLHGDGGADRLFGGAGNDVLDGDATNVAFEFHGDDYLDGEDGNDALQGGGGADTLFGGIGNDSLIGDGTDVPVAFAGDDYLDGEAGADVLEGGMGDDTLIGGAGSDILRGQAGDDFYVVTTGDQQDFVDDIEGANTIRFDSGGTFAGMSVFQSLGSDGKAYLEIRHTSLDRVFVRDGLTNTGIQYEFADGTVRSAADWRSKFTTFTTVSGTSGADDLAGTMLANSFTPGAGNDTIRFAPGSGFDRVSGFGQVNGESPGTDQVRVGGGLTAADLDVRRDSSSHLYLSIRETGDVLRLDNWGATSARAHAGHQVVFDDGLGLSAADLIALAAAGTDGADFLAGGSGDDVIDGGAGDDRIFGVSNSNPVIGAQDSNVLLGGEGNDQLSGGFGADVLDGGPGDDTLSGGTGADIHRWGPGDGNDVVTDGIGEGNVVELKPGLTSADVTLVQGSIVIYSNATGESLTLSGWYSESGLPSGHVPFVSVEELRFADGTVWGASLINEMANHATPFADLLRGMSTADVLHGLGGDDTLEGFSGDDVLAGGDGADTLWGGTGGDDLDGGAGDDHLNGENGDDVLRGGAGDDLLSGGAGHNVFLFGAGDGVDRMLSGADAVVEFDEGIDAAGVRLLFDGDTLRLDYGSGQVRPDLAAIGDPASHAIDLVRFADGTAWDRDALLARTEVEGDDPPPVEDPGGEPPVSTDDVLEGTAENDLLEGGRGNDVYVFGFGSGQDAIHEPGNTISGELNRATAGLRDTIRFGPGVTPQDVLVDFELDRPVFSLLGSGDTLTVVSWSDAAAGRVEFAEFDDGTVWDLGRFDYWSGSSSAGADIPDFVTGSKRHFPGHPETLLGLHDEIYFGQGSTDSVSDIHGHQTLYGGAGNDSLFTGNGDDLLDGGAGNDQLSPGTGDNRIRFGRGFGQDALNRPLATESLGVDVIVFGDDVPQEQVRLRRGPNAALILELAGTPDSLVISGALRGLAGRDRVRFEFADGTQWGPGAIEAHIQAVAVIEGGTGNNALIGGDGDDLFIGGEGNDTLTGGGGNDTFLFHRGDGADTIGGAIPRVLFGDGIAPGDVTLSGTNFAAGQRNLILTVSGNGGQLTLLNWFNTAGIDGSIEFADGTVWDAAYVGTLVPFAWVSGTSGSFFGTPGNDTYSAGATNDTLRGHAGDDTLSGNDGNDQVFGGDGHDVLAGGAGTDTLGGEAGDDQLSGGDGNDALTGGAGNDALAGDTGSDTLSGNAGGDALDGGAGDDQLAGGMDGDFLLGGEGADVLEGGLGDDWLEGGAGDDRLYGGAGSDTYAFGPGSGHDTLFDYDGTGVDFDAVLLADGVSPDDVSVERRGGDIVLTLAATGESLAIRSFGRLGYGVERVSFADGTAWDGDELRALAGVAAPGDRADIIYGTGDAELLTGLGGDDTLSGEAGADLLEGNAGDDVLDGGDDGDTLDGGAGADHLTGGAGADLFLVRTDSGSDSVADLSDGDTLNFGPGIAAGDVFVTRDQDHLYLELGATGQFVTLENWFAQGAGGAVAFEDGTRWSGAFLKPLVDALTDGDDFQVGTAGADRIESLGGLDTVFAAAGDDVVLGGSGSDTLHGETGADQLFGEAGYDLLQGGDGDDMLEGGGDDDALLGEAGNDVLRGGDGFDELDGGVGDDLLEGGGGAELLRGGAGSDVYVFAPGFGSDTLIDSDNIGSDVNVARFSGIAPEDVSFTWSGTEFLLAIEDSTDTLLLRDSLIPHFTAVRTIEFDDGTTWDRLQVYARTTRVGTEGNDTLTGGFKALVGLGGNDILTGGGGDELLDGGQGNDTLDGRQGEDVLVGGAGSDTYRFGPNWGHDVIREDDAGAPGTDTVILLAELPEVSIARVGQDIVIEIVETAATLTLEGWYDGAAHQVELLRFEEDVVWDAQTLGAYADVHQAPPESAPLAMTAFPEESEAEDDAPPSALLAVAVPGFTFSGDFNRGSGGDDVLDTLPGDDSAFGGPGADQLLGGEGDDFLGGEAGDDVLDGGTGRDILEGGLGDDRYLFGAGYGEDWAIDSGGVDEVLVDASLAPGAVVFTRDLSNLYLTSGADRLVLVDWFHRTDTRIETFRFGDGSTLDETAVRLAIAVPAAATGADTIFGSDRGESLLGLAGEDALYGEGGDDVLDGGAGSDYMLGGAGDDTYHVDNRLDRASELPGAGLDTVIASASYTLSPHVENLMLVGAAALNGTGNAGDNSIDGNAGANTLRGAEGNDLLLGGAGNDSYLVGLGDGEDVIEDIDATAGNLDDLRFGSGISAAGVRVSRVGEDVRLRLLGGGEVLLRNWFDPASRVELVRFADGTSWDAATIDLLANAPANEPPTLQQPIEDATATEDEAFARSLPPGTFADPDPAEPLVLTASLADGAPLPAWLAFDAASGAFAGTPGNDDVGAYAIRVAAADPAGESVADDFVLTVVNVNDAPQLALPLGDQSIAAGSEFTLALQDGTFTDVDAGDVLTYSASRADGGALPGWLSFGAASRTFNGTPAAGDAGHLAVRVTATDLAGAAASDEFSISVSSGEPQGEHLVGTRHGDILVGTPHDDVIEGRKGDDWLFGRQGDDLYLFDKGDGDDLVWDSGGGDTLRFGEGVEKRDVKVVRRHDDLVLKFKRGGDTVTLKDWFDSAARRVERVEFADGGSWNESDLRARAKWDHYDGWFGWDEHRDWDGGRDHAAWRWRGAEGHQHSHGGGGHERDLRDAGDSLVARIARAASYDFSLLAATARRDRDDAGGPMGAERIAMRWRDVQHAVESLAQGDDDSGLGAQRDRIEDLAADLPHGPGWGHAGSTGQRHGAGGMQSFAGLGEGFRKLG